jgi:hypothetical protein
MRFIIWALTIVVILMAIAGKSIRQNLVVTGGELVAL